PCSDRVLYSFPTRRSSDLIKATVLEAAAEGDIAFLNEWLLNDVSAGFDPSSLQWDGERLFQAARFSTEMQYQHLVFEEFARKIQDRKSTRLNSSHVKISYA